MEVKDENLYPLRESRTSGAMQMSDNFSRADEEALGAEADFYEHEQREQIANASYDRGFQAGADAARRECAELVDKAGEKWGDQARERKSKTYSAYAIAALDIQGQIRERWGQPVKEQQ